MPFREVGGWVFLRQEHVLADLLIFLKPECDE
jgi:hypothetical protein